MPDSTGRGAMKNTAGKRLKGIRLLAGLTQAEFAELSGIQYDRLRNIEPHKQRMADQDFEAICSTTPPIAGFLTHGGEISLMQLKQAEGKLAKLLVFRIELGEVPAGYGLESAIILDK